MLSITRVYNLGDYNSLRITVTLDNVDLSDPQSAEYAAKYTTILTDIMFYNYLTGSPVVNNHLSKTTMEQFKSALEKLIEKVKFVSVETQTNGEEE